MTLYRGGVGWSWPGLLAALPIFQGQSRRTERHETQHRAINSGGLDELGLKHRDQRSAGCGSGIPRRRTTGENRNPVKVDEAGEFQAILSITPQMCSVRSLGADPPNGKCEWFNVEYNTVIIAEMWQATTQSAWRCTAQARGASGCLWSCRCLHLCLR